MGTELIPAMAAGGSGGEEISECDLTLVLPGDADSLRPRMAAALERLGYRVLSEEPLHAKRAPRGWGVHSANRLDYPITLLIGFKSSGERATAVTFSYAIKHSAADWLTKGDQQTFTREAEAIAALAMQHGHTATCAACATQNPPEARFCRRCGAPLIAAEPPELEVLRLTAGSRASYQTLVAGIIFLAALCLLWLPIPFISAEKAIKALWWVGGALGAFGWFIMVFGLRRLHRTLNAPPTEPAQPVAHQRAVEAARTTVLPPQQTPMSVTETTTELLQPTEDAPPIQSPGRRRETA
jgi:ribosomal protein L40E